MSRPLRHPLIKAALLAAALSACANLNGNSAPVDLYDIVPNEPLAESVPFVLSDIEVRAPSWLARAAMQYRLEYEQPAQRRAYTQSRWVSPPAEMVEKFLDRAFAREVAAAEERQGTTGCRLRIELDEFSQAFSAADRSQSVILARAELLPTRGEQRLASHLITIREPTPTADAAGGVHAHRYAVERTAKDLATWLQALVKQSTSLAERCR